MSFYSIYLVFYLYLHLLNQDFKSLLQALSNLCLIYQIYQYGVFSLKLFRNKGRFVSGASAQEYGEDLLPHGFATWQILV